MAASVTSSVPAAAPTPRPSVALSLLRLMRPANLVTAAADILAGAVISGAPASRFGWLVGASICLYAGGVVLNDVFDRQLDAAERPERPIPSGVVSPSLAAVLGVALLLGGTALGFACAPRSGVVAVFIAGAVLIYDVWAKRNAAGPLIMGLCRGLNLALGLTAVAHALPRLWPLTLLPLLYILAITSLSRGEVHGGKRTTSGLALAIFLCVALGLLALPGVLGAAHLVAVVPLLALFAARVGWPLWRSWQQPTASTIRAAVHAGVVSLIVLDACIATAFGGIVQGAAVLSLSVISAELARFFAVT